MKKVLIYIFVFGTILVVHYCYSWSTKSDLMQGIVVESKEINILEWWDSKETITNYLKGSQYVFVHGHLTENRIFLYFQYAEFRSGHYSLENRHLDPDTWKVDKPGYTLDIDCVHIGVVGPLNKVCINGLEILIIKVEYMDALLQPKPLNKVITIKAPCLHKGRLISKNQIRSIVDGLTLTHEIGDKRGWNYIDNGDLTKQNG